MKVYGDQNIISNEIPNANNGHGEEDGLSPSKRQGKAMRQEDSGSYVTSELVGGELTTTSPLHSSMPSNMDDPENAQNRGKQIKINMYIDKGKYC